MSDAVAAEAAAQATEALTAWFVLGMFLFALDGRRDEEVRRDDLRAILDDAMRMANGRVSAADLWDELGKRGWREMILDSDQLALAQLRLCGDGPPVL